MTPGIIMLLALAWVGAAGSLALRVRHDDE